MAQPHTELVLPCPSVSPVFINGQQKILGEIEQIAEL